MDTINLKWGLIFFLAIGTMMKTIMANVVDDFDGVWQMRAQEARNASLRAYDPHPHRVVKALNEHIKLTTEGIKELNSTRRNLRGRKKTGACLAVNPIDHCWRCQRKWHLNRKRLADCAIGFARGTTGGKAGNFYVVTDPSDNDMVNPKPGTLRHAVIQKEPLWIIFGRSMMIKLNAELIMQGDKTIDGRGASVHIAYGAGITIQFVKNVIIHGIKIHDIVQGNGGNIRDSVDHVGFRTISDGDGISVFGSSHVWIDHLSMWNCQDGLIDVIEASTAITISNCHFTDHNDVMLFGAHDTNSVDKIMQVTVAFNHFGKRLVQRMPRCRWGFVHIINNDYTHWLMYAIGGSSQPTIISQGNRFIAPPIQSSKMITHRNYAPESVWMSWTWRSEGDLMLNGAYFVQSGDPSASMAMGQLDSTVAQPGSAAPMLTRYAGALTCLLGKPC